MTPTTEATYLGILDGEHWWSNGDHLPILLGFDASDDDADEEHEDDPEDDSDAEAEEEPENIKDPKRARAARQAGKYRTERNEARTQRDDALMQLAFVRAADSEFVDLDAAWKLVDRSLLTIENGSVSGAEEAVAALAEAHPFLLTPAPADDRDDADANPFKAEPRSSGRPMNGKKKRDFGYDRATLAKKYPALRRR